MGLISTSAIGATAQMDCAERKTFPSILPVFFATTIVFLIVLYAFGTVDIEEFSFVAQNQILLSLAIVTYCFILGTTYALIRRIDAYMLFVFISFLFFFGQQTLVATGLAPDSMWLSKGLLSNEVIVSASVFTLASLLAMHAGYLTYCFSGIQRGSVPGLGLTEIRSNADSAERLRKICLVVFAITVLPTVAHLANSAFLTYVSGYGERLTDSQATSGIMNVLSVFMPYTLLGLIITRRKGEKWPYIALIGYIVLYTLQGSRTNTFILLVSLVYVQLTCFPWKSRKNQLIIYLGISVVVAILFSIISGVRGNLGNEDFSFGSLFESISLYSENNFFVSILKEAGTTFTVLGAVMANTPNPIEHVGGSSYLSGLLYTLPNSLNGNIYQSVPSTDEVFASFLTQYGGVGSSFIAEGYYNFGNASIFLFLIFGMLFAFLARQLELSIATGNYWRLFCCVTALAIILFYVRSDTRSFFRNFTWTVLLYWTIGKTLQRERPSKRQCHNE